jgi:thiol-disulfide isomerase/thioredoxin
MRRTDALLAVVALAAGVLSGCSGGGRGNGALQPFPTPPSYDELVHRAALDPCPGTSSAAPVAHGLPDVTLPCLAGGPAVHLAALRGTPTLLNIWGTWCTPCQKETTFLAQVYPQVKAHVRFIGVDTEDDAKSALDFAPHVRPPMHYPQLFDSDKRLLVALRLQAVPSTVFVDADGHIVHITRDYYRSAAALRADLTRYLGVGA